ncbi:hypothetical protein N431DRAFT_456979 [Stipitochalara longipes BDJ]|nr:hypothetical protein N431DRAFT_456979 [Stipitochalara longipes BDJ]
MCWHRRIIYSCNHYAWGAEITPCALEKLYRAGEWSETCDTMNSHPLHSLTTQKPCKKCERRKVKLEGTMSRLRLLMKQLNESVSKLKKEETREQRPLLVSIAGVQWIPVSPVEEDDEEWLCSPFLLDHKSLTSGGVDSRGSTKNVQEQKQASV